MNLTHKEKELLQEAMEHERVCIAKYREYTKQLQDPQLKSLFAELQTKEEIHAQTISQLLQEGGYSS